MSRDKGWEFLFHEHKESGSFSDDEGHEGYIYSDGSGYFRGADGSDGYIYSDGSGYFRGADGRDGYKYSDGSGHFRGGPKNIDAYQYSDGSGYYGDDDRCTEHYDSVEEMEHDNVEPYSGTEAVGFGAVGLTAGLIGVATAIGSKIHKKRRSKDDFSNYWDDDENGDADNQYIVPERQRANNSHNRPTSSKRTDKSLIAAIVLLLIVALIPACILFGMHLHKENAKAQGKVSAGYYRDLIGKDYEAVEAHFRAAGFTDIELIDLDDSGLLFWRDGKVEMIFIGGDTDFESTDYFDPTTKVVISYH